MKCRIEIDCTPLEARQFFGLPDVQPLQARMMDELQAKILAEMERLSPEAVMKTWMSFFGQTPEQLQDAFGKLMMNGFGRSSS
jgi:hypothetical protein